MKKITKKCPFCGGTLTPVYNGNATSMTIKYWECSRKSCQFGAEGDNACDGITNHNLKMIEALQKDKANAVNELLECRSYVRSYAKTLSEEMTMHVADKFPNGYMAKLLQSEEEEGMKAILRYRKERLNETNNYN